MSNARKMKILHSLSEVENILKENEELTAKMLECNNSIRKDLAVVKQLVSQKTHPGDNLAEDCHSHSGSITTEPAVGNEVGSFGQDETSEHEGVEIEVVENDEASISIEDRGGAGTHLRFK